MQLYPHRARMKKWHYCKALFIKKEILQRCVELIIITVSMGIRWKAIVTLQASGCIEGNKHTHTLISRNHNERKRGEESKEGRTARNGGEGEESEVPVVSELALAAQHGNLSLPSNVLVKTSCPCIPL